MAYDADKKADGLDAKATPVDADRLPFWDSVTSLLSQFTWANLKAALYLSTVTSDIQAQLDEKASAALNNNLANGEHDGPVEDILLGATVTAGQALEQYNDAGTTKFKPAVKNSTTGASHLALAAGDAGDTIQGLIGGLCRMDDVFNFTEGNLLWRDLTTDGSITSTQPTAEDDVMQFLALRRSDHVILWCPFPLPMTLGVQP